MVPQPFTSILLKGLAPTADSRHLRTTSPSMRLRGCARYRALAFEILSRYMDDIAPVDLRAITRTYTAQAFGSDDITPLTTLEPGMHLLRASNGPTLAFKDVALQLLGNLFEHVLTQRSATLNILGATSGDTGPSAEYAMRGKRNVAVFMLSPHGKMSPFQAAQM
jgi:threonine synthase